MEINLSTDAFGALEKLALEDCLNPDAESILDAFPLLTSILNHPRDMRAITTDNRLRSSTHDARGYLRSEAVGIS